MEYRYDMQRNQTSFLLQPQPKTATTMRTMKEKSDVSFQEITTFLHWTKNGLRKLGLD